MSKDKDSSIWPTVLGALAGAGLGYGGGHLAGKMLNKRIASKATDYAEGGAWWKAAMKERIDSAKRMISSPLSDEELEKRFAPTIAPLLRNEADRILAESLAAQKLRPRILGSLGSTVGAGAGYALSPSSKTYEDPFK